MKPFASLLDCVSYFVTDLSVTANREYQPEQAPNLNWDDIDIDTHLAPPSADVNHWQVTLKITQNVPVEKNAPYNYSLTLVGLFEARKGGAASDAEKLVRINGSSVLYSVAREILRGAMAKGPFMPIMLPTVSFNVPDSKTGSSKQSGKAAKQAGRTRAAKRSIQSGSDPRGTPAP